MMGVLLLRFLTSSSPTPLHLSLPILGTYLSRSLSYKGADFCMEEIELDPIMRVMYDRSCMLWELLFKVCVKEEGRRGEAQSGKSVPCRSSCNCFFAPLCGLSQVLELLPQPKKATGSGSRGGRDFRKSLFWVANQRFYRQMLLAAKVPSCVELALKVSGGSGLGGPPRGLKGLPSHTPPLPLSLLSPCSLLSLLSLPSPCSLLSGG
jgi:hypothetical protein